MSAPDPSLLIYFRQGDSRNQQTRHVLAAESSTPIPRVGVQSPSKTRTGASRSGTIDRGMQIEPVRKRQIAHLIRQAEAEDWSDGDQVRNTAMYEIRLEPEVGTTGTRKSVLPALERSTSDFNLTDLRLFYESTVIPWTMRMFSYSCRIHRRMETVSCLARYSAGSEPGQRDQRLLVELTWTYSPGNRSLNDPVCPADPIEHVCRLHREGTEDHEDHIRPCQ
ncbi:hypothetical protein BDV28DRAFT_127793 [Aspergillus coremiiformis]|uniref:Uncharacterized protein n=1 Tax=Aspergillus coremiiformis TaxID=138285 RepID=A0A5N6ZIP5_9EURO|nr:hypothetical protein BDV28DRAFT_127793 [Aspergillus coremiiformis]